MDIRNTRDLKHFAAQRVENTPVAKTIALVCAAVIIGTAFLNTGINYLLDLRIGETGGLSNIGTRSLLATLQTFFPYLRMALVMCVELGYTSAMLRIARGQYTSLNAFRLGFDRFWLALGTRIWEYLAYVGIMFVSTFLGVQLFLLTPLSDNTIAIVEPYIDSGMEALLLDEAAYAQFAASLWPALIFAGALYALLAIPVTYQYRMASFVIIDKPGIRPRTVLKESTRMMRRHRFQLFRLDVSLWAYYLLKVLASVVCYGDSILPLMGIQLPISETAGYFLFFALYLVMEFAIFYFMQNRVTTTYALAYDSLRPKEEPTNGVVLGNIFNM